MIQTMNTTEWIQKKVISRSRKSPKDNSRFLVTIASLPILWDIRYMACEILGVINLFSVNRCLYIIDLAIDKALFVIVGLRKQKLYCSSRKNKFVQFVSETCCHRTFVESGQ